MSGASMNDIKSRIKSVTGTMQITKAMELVATSKLRRAREKVENSRPFHNILSEAIESIATSDEVAASVWSKNSEGKKPLYIVIAGDRGLAGGYNANIFRLTATLSADKESCFLPIGKKALDYYNHRGATLLSSDYGSVSDISVGDALAISQSICERFLSDEFDSVIVVYTKFASMISQIPVYEQLLPLERELYEGKK